MTRPYFTVVTALFNRADIIKRAIDSCLSQSLGDFELVIVDDCSTDASVAEVKRYTDKRILLLRHDCNRGPGPARNTAVEHSSGQWIVMLDSDFSLLPGAFANLYERTERAKPDIGNVASSCVWDRKWPGGNVTPLPDVPPDAIDYIGYLRWTDRLIVSEYINCIRREVFDQIRYPDSRAWETRFHLDLAQTWTLHVTRDVVVKVYTDAANRLTTSKGAWAFQRTLAEAHDKLVDLKLTWLRHGAAMKEYAPNRYLAMYRDAGRLSFICGNRRDGLRYMATYLRQAPFDARAWSIPFIGLLGPRSIAWAATRR